MKDEAGLARKTAAPAISSGWPMRRRAAVEVCAERIAGFSHSARAKSVLMRPGAMQFTRIPSTPQLFAHTCVSMMAAAFETE